jgi:HEAT repeat protein
MPRLNLQISKNNKTEVRMNRVLILTVAATLLAFSSVLAVDPQTTKSAIDMDKVEASLLNGLNSENQGLIISSSQMLGDIKSGKAVIPLMHMLKSDNSESSKIAAALALYNIGDERGLYAIKRAAKFDDSNKVRSFCNKFYKAYKTTQS